MPIKQYLTLSTMQAKQVNLGEFEAGGTPTFRFDSQAALTKAANKQFGENKWKWKDDTSLVGGYIVCTEGENKGDSIHVDPFPVE